MKWMRFLLQSSKYGTLLSPIFTWKWNQCIWYVLTLFSRAGIKVFLSRNCVKLMKTIQMERCFDEISSNNGGHAKEIKEFLRSITILKQKILWNQRFMWFHSHRKKISSNQLVHFFIKTVTFTKFLPKKCESKFPTVW